MAAVMSTVVTAMMTAVVTSVVTSVVAMIALGALAVVTSVVTAVMTSVMTAVMTSVMTAMMPTVMTAMVTMIAMGAVAVVMVTVRAPAVMGGVRGSRPAGSGRDGRWPDGNVDIDSQEDAGRDPLARAHARTEKQVSATELVVVAWAGDVALCGVNNPGSVVINFLAAVAGAGRIISNRIVNEEGSHGTYSS